MNTTDPNNRADSYAVNLRSLRSHKDILADFNAKLPAGIVAEISRGSLRYVVRTSFKGKKVSLGTFLDFDAALRAVVEYKIAGMTLADHSAMVRQMLAEYAAAEKESYELDKQAILSAAASLPTSDMYELLDTLPPHELQTDTPTKVTKEDGSVVTIAPHVVSMYLKRMVGEEDASL
jgi:hypothetical protein